MKQFILLVTLLYATYAQSQNSFYSNQPNFPDVELSKFELVKKDFFSFDESLQNDLDFDHCQWAKYAFLFKEPENWKLIQAGFFSTDGNLPLTFQQAGKYGIILEQDGVAIYFLEIIASTGQSKMKLYKQSNLE